MGCSRIAKVILCSWIIGYKRRHNGKFVEGEGWFRSKDWGMFYGVLSDLELIFPTQDLKEHMLLFTMGR